MSALLISITNINSDMTALNNENPNSGPITGVFSLLGMEPGNQKGTIYSANIIPRSQNVTGYTFELAYYAKLTGVPQLPASQRMWYWSAPDRQVVTLPLNKAPAPSNPAEAMRYGGQWFQIERPAGMNQGYVRVSALAGQGTPGVDLMIWRYDPT